MKLVTPKFSSASNKVQFGEHIKSRAELEEINDVLEQVAKDVFEEADVQYTGYMRSTGTVSVTPERMSPLAKIRAKVDKAFKEKYTYNAFTSKTTFTIPKDTSKQLEERLQDKIEIEFEPWQAEVDFVRSGEDSSSSMLKVRDLKGPFNLFKSKWFLGEDLQNFVKQVVEDIQESHPHIAKLLNKNPGKYV